MKFLFLSLIILLFASCGKSKIDELVEIVDNYQSETHVAPKDKVTPVDLKPSRPTITATQTKQDFVCQAKKISENINSSIRAKRKVFLNLIEKQRKDEPLSVNQKKAFVKLLMEFRLLGKSNYYYSVTKFSATEIEKKLAASAKKYVLYNGLPKKCSYVVKRGLSYYTKNSKILSVECSDEFLKRAQVISPSMAAAQATLESAWGSSRFAREGNNYYGLQFRFSDVNESRTRPRCLPAKKDPNRCVYKFDNFNDSMMEYYRFLNAGTYQPVFREYRGLDEVSLNQSCLDASEMIEGLINYAENPKYVEDVLQRLKLICPMIDNCL